MSSTVLNFGDLKLKLWNLSLHRYRQTAQAAVHDWTLCAKGDERCALALCTLGAHDVRTTYGRVIHVRCYTPPAHNAGDDGSKQQHEATTTSAPVTKTSNEIKE